MHAFATVYVSVVQYVPRETPKTQWEKLRRNLSTVIGKIHEEKK
jgi:hypothetical protein